MFKMDFATLHFETKHRAQRWTVVQSGWFKRRQLLMDPPYIANVS